MGEPGLSNRHAPNIRIQWDTQELLAQLQNRMPIFEDRFTLTESQSSLSQHENYQGHMDQFQVPFGQDLGVDENQNM